MIAGGSSSINYRELVVGDADTEWADANEVLVERIVGEISVLGGSHVDGASSIYDHWTEVSPVVRLGLLVLEDFNDGATATPVTPGLWNADDLQDGEWMWLHQMRAFPHGSHLILNTDLGRTEHVFAADLHIDVRVKRKLGRRDRLVLLHEFTVVGAANESVAFMQVHPLLRCLVSTK